MVLFISKWNFLTFLLVQNIPLDIFHKVPSKCGFIGGWKPPPLQELIAQNPYRSRVNFNPFFIICTKSSAYAQYLDQFLEATGTMTA